MKLIKFAGLILVPTLLLSMPLAPNPANSTEGNTLSNLADKAGSLKESPVKDLVNINTASENMLAKVPGIGPQLSKAITAYRDKNGAFKNIKDLLKVDGMSGDMLSKIQPLISL